MLLYVVIGIIPLWFCPQTSVGDVEMLLKQHENFEKTLSAQEEKLTSLSDMAKSLVNADHHNGQW